MRTDCKHYESRTYPTGESVRKCDLDLAPEAPWRCPENCPAFAPRLVDVGWSWGDLNRTPDPDEPPIDEHTAALLDHAEDIVNTVGPEVLEEFRRLDAQRQKGGRWLGKLPKPKSARGKGKRKRR